MRVFAIDFEIIDHGVVGAERLEPPLVNSAAVAGENRSAAMIPNSPVDQEPSISSMRLLTGFPLTVRLRY